MILGASMLCTGPSNFRTRVVCSARSLSTSPVHFISGVRFHNSSKSNLLGMKLIKFINLLVVSIALCDFDGFDALVIFIHKYYRVGIIRMLLPCGLRYELPYPAPRYT